MSTTTIFNKPLNDELTQLKNAVSGKQDAPSDSGTAGQVLGLNNDLDPVWTTPQGGGEVQDVQVNGTSVLNDGVANIPYASAFTPGVVKTGGGITMVDGTNLSVSPASSNDIKGGAVARTPVSPVRQHEAVFYGLSKVAGQDLASETVTLGQYPASSKTAIKTMLGIVEPSSIIDDTAGSGDIDKTFSADKLTSGHTNLLSAITQNESDISDLQKDKADVIVNSASGAIASFSDGAEDQPVRDCVVQIEPVQDLHGQDNPYPAGGGKNLLPITISTSTTSGVTFTVNDDGTISTSGTATADINKTINTTTKLVSGESYKLAGCASGSDGSNYYIRSTRGITAGTTGSDFSGAVTATGEELYLFIHVSNGVNTNGLVFKPMICLATETDSTFAPYSNICPITGWTGANVTRTGKNLLPSIMTQSGTNVVVLGQNDPDSFGLTLKAGTYTVSLETDNLGAFYYREKDGTENKHIGGYNTASATFTLAKDVTIRLWYYKYDGVSTSDLSKPQLELGSTASEYVPFNGTTYSITFPSEAGTVYGGTLDVTTGVLTVDKKSFAFKDLVTQTGSQTTWSYNSTYNVFETSNSIIPVGSADTETGVVCACYNSKPYGYNGSYSSENSVVWAHTSGTLRVRDNRYTNVNTWKTAIADEQIVIPLATPITYQLTPTEITTLLCENHLFADCGNISVDYRADTKTYVDESIPSVPVQDVQVNGTSILNNNVANIPYANGSTFGVTKVNSARGITTDSTDNDLAIVKASDSQVKAGTSQYRPLVPYNQDQSVFYGLAKCSGDTTQSASSNAVGTYTADALVKIQKMLGIYEAPWELIREDSITNATEGGLTINVDDNGNAFELTDVRMMLWFPTQANEAKIANGIASFRNGSTIITEVAVDSKTVAANSALCGAYIMIEQRDGMMYQQSTSWHNQSVMGTVRMTINPSRSSYYHPFKIMNKSYISSVVFSKITGTLNYLLYGKRKWTA